ncbi:MAG: hypothetical protein AAGF11_00140 [Myxococcota bacterium]
MRRRALLRACALTNPEWDGPGVFLPGGGWYTASAPNPLVVPSAFSYGVEIGARPEAQE